MLKNTLLLFVLAVAVFSCKKTTQQQPSVTVTSSQDTSSVVTKIYKTEAEWKDLLSADVYYIARQKGTERAFTGKYYDYKAEGTYQCKCCELPLFRSSDKFDSGTGWPSFTQPYKKGYVNDIKDTSHGMIRTEVTCARCDAHLGHVFNDGPAPTGLRYCINSAVLSHVPLEK